MANKRNEQLRKLVLKLRAKFPRETGEQIAARASLELGRKVSQQVVSYYSKSVLVKKS